MLPVLTLIQDVAECRADTAGDCSHAGLRAALHLGW